jgi:hypothetical protein
VVIGEPVRECGLAVRCACSLTISPGGGRFGSFICKFIKTVDRRLPVCDDCRFRLAELMEGPINMVSRYP